MIREKIRHSPQEGVVRLIIAILFFALFGVLKTHVYLFLACASIVPIVLDFLFCEVHLRICASRFSNNDAIYCIALLWHRFSHIAFSIFFYVLAKNMSTSLIFKRLCLLYMIASIVQSAQRSILFVISYFTIWKAYASRIQLTVLSNQIIIGITNYIQKFDRNFKLSEYQTTNTLRKSTVFEDCLQSFQSTENPETERPKLDVTDYTKEKVPLRKVHEAIDMHIISASDAVKTYEALKKKFPVLNYPALQTIFSGNKTMAKLAHSSFLNYEIITREDFVNCYQHVALAQKNLHANIHAYESMVSTLNYALTCVSLVIMLFACLITFGIDVVKNSALVVSCFIALSIIFGTTLTRFFEGIVHVFFIKMYSIGDTVYIKDERLIDQIFTVERMSLLTTTFRRDDGVSVIISNFRIKDSVVQNMYNSGFCTHLIDLKLPALNGEQVNFLQTELKTKFNANLVLLNFDLGNTYVQIQIPNKSNFQDIAAKKKQFAEVTKFVNEILMTPPESIQK